MLSTAIRQRVRDNLNRDDSGINTKIESWINDTKRRVEQILNLDYMKATTDLSFAAGTSTATLPDRWKAEISARIRKTVPVAQRETSWSKSFFRKLGEDEIVKLTTYDSAGAEERLGDPPVGYALTETTMSLYPIIKTTDTWLVRVRFWQFSADWTFGVSEEPYLAKFAWQAIIDGATSLGFAWMGQLGDEEKWERKFMTKLEEFHANESKRALTGEIEFRPHTGMDDARPSQPNRWMA